MKGKKGRGVWRWTRKGKESERSRGGQGKGNKWSGVGRWTRKGRERERGRGG